MAKLITPSENVLDGPWLLGKDQLSLLNTTIEKIEQHLKKAEDIRVTSEAEIHMQEYQNIYPNLTIEQAKEKVKKYSTSRRKENYSIIHTKEGKVIEDESLLGILKDPQVDHYTPTELRIKRAFGASEFSLKVSEYGKLYVNTLVANESIQADINYEIKNWIDPIKPKILVRWWSEVIPYMLIPIGIILLLIGLNNSPTNLQLYKEELSRESYKLLENGLSPEEETKAIEIILEDRSNYVPNDFKPVPQKSKHSLFWVTSIVGIIILSIRPKTVIGLGKNEWKVKFYTVWIYIVLSYIPLDIAIQILLAKIM